MILEFARKATVKVDISYPTTLHSFDANNSQYWKNNPKSSAHISTHVSVYSQGIRPTKVLATDLKIR
ncbi:MAG: hypothetical protein HKM23_00650 [Nitrosopumilus sp.]|nr:hypothetical protein [Nitrosopumilus sp.]